MAKILKADTVIDLKVTLQLNEQEARALHALTVYGANSFLEVFYRHLGMSYLSPHEKGLRTLFEEVKSTLPEHFTNIDKVRKTP